MQCLDNVMISFAVDKFKGFDKPWGLAKEVFVNFNYFARLFIYFINLLTNVIVLS